MPTIQDLKARLQQIREAVEQKLPDIAATLALSAKALSERRIKDQGFGAGYSLNRVPAWFMLGKELNQSGAVFIKAKIKQDQKNTHVQDGVKFYPDDYGTNWGDFRRAQGLQSYHVDLGYTNMMWGNMQVVRIEQDSNITRALLGGSNNQAQNEMNYNRDRYGPFVQLGLQPSDVKLLSDTVGAEVRLVLDQFKL